MTEIIKNGANWSVIVQALIIAAITSTATGYVSAKVLETKVDYLSRELIRIDQQSKDNLLKLDAIAIRQASVISQADTIHGYQNQRIDKLELKVK